MPGSPIAQRHSVTAIRHSDPSVIHFPYKPRSTYLYCKLHSLPLPNGHDVPELYPRDWGFVHRYSRGFELSLDFSNAMQNFASSASQRTRAWTYQKSTPPHATS